MKRLMTAFLFSAGVVLAPVAVASGVASAAPLAASQSDCYPTCHGGGSSGHTLAGAPPAAPSSSQLNTATGLAFTGTDAAATAGVALALLGGGAVLVGASRRRRSSR
ncbi:MAG TPA: hypothetical protein VKV25_00700 [Acidimicrobiales bacterium]|nr:hypothetical protein [Acidimicrobiales bacterium]